MMIVILTAASPSLCAVRSSLRLNHRSGSWTQCSAAAERGAGRRAEARTVRDEARGHRCAVLRDEGCSKSASRVGNEVVCECRGNRVAREGYGVLNR
eukprot:1370879-Amorphochlora_amoeboformis.AAC.1